jgi:hypothetical protein
MKNCDFTFGSAINICIRGFSIFIDDNGPSNSQKFKSKIGDIVSNYDKKLYSNILVANNFINVYCSNIIFLILS